MSKKPRSPEETPVNAKPAPQARRQDPWITALAVFAVILIVWALFMGSESRTRSPGESASTAQPVALADGETARGLIAHQGKTLSSADIEAIYERAEGLRKAGKLDDAYLLYFYAARNGHGRSALTLGDMAAPDRFQSAGSPLDHPDPYQAYKWYRAAEKAGVEEAAARLRKLEESLRTAANDNDAQAQRLLLLWR